MSRLFLALMLAGCAQGQIVSRSYSVSTGNGEGGTATLVTFTPNDMVNAPGPECRISGGNC